MDLRTLFLAHLGRRMAWLEQGLAATGFDALVISSGAPVSYYADDHEAPFQGVPHFRGGLIADQMHNLMERSMVEV